MFDSVLEAIEKWAREMLEGMVDSNVSTMFADVNEKTASIATQVSATPSGWNSGIFSLVQNLSENVILPVAGLVITYVLVFELIRMLTERNNLHEVDTWMFFAYFFKAAIAVWLVSNTFTIVMAFFDVGQHVVSQAAGLIGAQTDIDPTAVLDAIHQKTDSMELGELAMLAVESAIVSLGMKILSVLITVVIYGRMIEIYLMCSVAPIPMATLGNREIGQIGHNFVRAIAALAFQGFFIIVCVGIYAVLVAGITSATDVHAALFELAGMTILLCFSLFKTGGLAKSVFSAH